MLVGVGSGEPAFEVLQGSAEIQLGSSGILGIVGIDGTASLNGKEYPLAARIPVVIGDKLSITARCACLAIGTGSGEPIKLDWTPVLPSSLRFLTPGSTEFMQTVTVSRAFSRSGVRLEGIAPQNLPELPSEPSSVGAIQRTPSGELIVIGPDGPTIGGYPKLGSVIEADLPLIPRLKIGQPITLRSVTWSEAMTAYAERHKELSAIENLWKLSQSV